VSVNSCHYFFCFSHFKIGVYNEYHDNWHCATDFVFLNHLEALKRKCCKKVIVVQMRNLIVEILKHYSFYMQCHFFFFPIKKLDHVKFGGKRLDNLHIGIR
jgi:hypothetical protein